MNEQEKQPPVPEELARWFAEQARLQGRVIVYYTTNSTAPETPSKTYTDGFDDGWNAREAIGQ